MVALGRRIYGLGAVGLGLVGLVWGDFALQWQPVPAGVHHRAALAYAIGAALVLAGAALWRRRTAIYGAAVLTILYGLCVILLHLPKVIGHPLVFARWSGAAEQLALTAGGLIAYAASGRIGARTARLSHVGRMTFGLCLLIFGAAHFFYLDFTASMVPKYLPPSQTFWAVATGGAHIAAGLAILSGRQARLAATLVTAMFAGFGVLVHAPALLADPRSHLNWVANAMNLALTGAAWLVADSSGRRR